jgi:O-antigen/teichoic acid export membrane protein
MKFLVDTQFDWLYVFTMVLILSTQYYFSYFITLPQRLLITADQKIYIIQFTQTIATIVNLMLCVLVIRLGGGIHSVKLTTTVVFLLNPLVLYIYVKRNYQIQKSSDVKDVPVPQKRDGVIHHLAYFIHSNTDIVILSLFSSLANVSAYTVYNTVIYILERLLTSISSGMSGMVGNLLARDEIKRLNLLLDRYEVWSNALATAIATVCSILILPFVSIYTKGVTDAEYHQPVFAFLMIAGSYAYSIRHPFGCVVSAAGHYKETKVGAVVEMALNLGLSLVLVKPLGLIGVALGTFLSMSYRTIYTVWYLSKHLLHRPVWRFMLRLVCNLMVSALLICWIPRCLNVTAPDIPGLLICAVKVSVIVFPIFVLVNALLSFRTLKEAIEQ